MALRDKLNTKILLAMAVYYHNLRNNNKNYQPYIQSHFHQRTQAGGEVTYMLVVPDKRENSVSQKDVWNKDFDIVKIFEEAKKAGWRASKDGETFFFSKKNKQFEYNEDNYLVGGKLIVQNNNQGANSWNSGGPNTTV